MLAQTCGLTPRGEFLRAWLNRNWVRVERIRKGRPAFRHGLNHTYWV